MRVGLFITCLDDVLFPDVGRAVVRLLERQGHEVDVPGTQTCCGQLQFNTGYRADCLPLVDRFATAFADYDAVVTPSASCAAMVRMHHEALAREAGKGELATAAAAVAPRVFELTELLVDVLGVMDFGAQFGHAVALHPTCHSVRLLGIGDRPARLLERVEGLRLVDLPRADACCGFGGTFAVKNADVSIAMGRDKVAAIEASGAEVLTAADMSCLLHLGGMLSRRRSPIRVMHLAEILASGTMP